VSYILVAGYLDRKSSRPAGLCHRLAEVVLAKSGDFKVAASAWFLNSRGDIAEDAPKLYHRAISLEDLLISDELHRHANEAIGICIEHQDGPLSSSDAAFPVWTVDYFNAAKSAWKVPLRTAGVCLRTSMFPKGRKDANREIIAFVRRVVGVLGESEECLQGWVDVARPIGTGGARYFQGSDWEGWHRQVEEAEFTLNVEERRERVRGPYWGTYLGPQLARKLDMDGSFEKRFLTEAPRPEYAVRTQFVDRLPSGGMFIGLSDNPVWLAERGLTDEEAVENAVWLRNEFRKHGML
jgi:hypothetical protein